MQSRRPVAISCLTEDQGKLCTCPCLTERRKNNHVLTPDLGLYDDIGLTKSVRSYKLLVKS